MNSEDTVREMLRQAIQSLNDAERQTLQYQLLRKDDTAAANHRAQLVAFSVAGNSNTPSSDELRGFLKDRLPNHMIPQHFAFVDALPRLANGKINRNALPDLELPSVNAGPEDVAAPRNEKETVLSRIWCEVLGLDDVGVHENYFEIGGDSLLSIRILARAKAAGLAIPPDKFFEAPTIAEQASLAEKDRPTTAERGIVTGTAPLLPIQHWFFDCVRGERHHWNQSVLLTVSERLNRSDWERVVQTLLGHHDGLRAGFNEAGGVWRMHIENVSSQLPFDWIGRDADADIEDHARNLNASFRLDEPPLIRFALFESASGTPDRLLIVAHHLIIDAISWQLLIEDLRTLCDQLLSNATPRLPAKTSSLKSWARRLQDWSDDEALIDDRTHWQREASAGNGALPTDVPKGKRSELQASTEQYRVELEASDSERLLTLSRSELNAGIHELLITALGMSLIEWTGQTCVQIDIEGHGRESLFEDLDINRTIGWFTTVYPVTLAIEPGAENGTALRSVKSTLRSIPHRGISHGAQYYLASNGVAQASRPECCFNYLGDIDTGGDRPGLIEVKARDLGTPRSPLGERPYAIELNTMLSGGRLLMIWSYSPGLHRPLTIRTLADSMRKNLLNFNETSRESAQGAADFPLADLDQDEFDKLSATLAELDDSP